MSRPAMTTERIDPLAGEGDTKFVAKTRVRRECVNCGDPATKLFWFSYINGRNNPASSSYGRDDCTYCRDSEALSCDACARDVERNECPDGMRWAATITCAPQNAHHFLRWVENDKSASVLELVEADREYDAAEEAWDYAPGHVQAIGDTDGRDYDGPEFLRVCAAAKRRAAALAAFGRQG